MRDFVVKPYEIGTRPMRSEIVKASDPASVAVLTGERLRSSRFRASVHADGALLFHIHRGGSLTPPPPWPVSRPRPASQDTLEADTRRVDRSPTNTMLSPGRRTLNSGRLFAHGPDAFPA